MFLYKLEIIKLL